MYSSEPGVASVESAPNVSSEVSATGPVWRYGDDATSAAASGGSAAARSPRWGGIPASWAYASDWGSRTRATLIPATRSPHAGRPPSLVPASTRTLR